MFQNRVQMNRRRVEIAVIAILAIGIIGYAGVGLAVSATRVASAERILNAVVSHQNTLNSTFRDINAQHSGLSSGADFNPQQAIVLIDKSVSNSELATKTINADEASLNDASSQLASAPWLTLVWRNSLDRESTRIGHAHNALAAARTIAEDEGADGRFWHSLLAVLGDLTTINTQTAGGDLTGAQTTLGTMKADVAEAARLATAPGLPDALRSLVADLQGLAGDYGKQLDAQAAGDQAGVASSLANLNADLQKVGAYDFDKIGSDIVGFFQPLIDRYNSEIAAATS